MVRTTIALILLVLLTSGLTGCTIGKHNGEPIAEINPLDMLFPDDDCPCHCDKCQDDHDHH